VLPVQALEDLSVWACEPGACSRRALLSLIQYYQFALQRDRSPDLLNRLYNQMLDSRSHSTLRVEIAYILQDQAAFTPDVLTRMMVYHQPSQLRLLAASEALKKGFDETALETLREVARQPNREIALGVAHVLQTTMQIEMGLPENAALPAANSKLAAEIARRVILWTQGKWTGTEPELESSPFRQTPNARDTSTARLPRPATAATGKAIIETPWLE
jgi:hypothetical protein